MEMKTIIIIILCFFILDVFIFWKFIFSRKPVRNIPVGQELVSPANGKILKIIPFDQENVVLEKGYFGKIPVWTNDVSNRGNIVVIMMTPLNVHVQRAPFSAEVISKKHVPGKFLNAVAKDEAMQATFENEHNEILFRMDSGHKFKVVQIAGFLARRIHDYTKIGDKKEKGSEIGFIDLGSQVALILPAEFEILVNPDEIVIDGETKIAKLK